MKNWLKRAWHWMTRRTPPWYHDVSEEIGQEIEDRRKPIRETTVKRRLIDTDDGGGE